MRALALADLLAVATAAPALASDRQERRLDVLDQRVDRLQLAYVMTPVRRDDIARTKGVRRWAAAELRRRSSDDRPHRWHRFAAALYVWSDYSITVLRGWPIRVPVLEQREVLWVAMWARFDDWRGA
ncbi:hypothetical protein BH23CHL8_BH23CHL8_18980 [soil metagenome]